MVHWRGRGRISKTKFLDSVKVFVMNPSPRAELLKLHDDVRFNILTELYQYNFGDRKESTILVDIDFITVLNQMSLIRILS
jgi:hypothetical protein